MLEDLYQRGIIYDWENYRNCHICTLYSLRSEKYATFVINDNRDDRAELIKVIRSKVNGKPRILIGYNSLGYDSSVTLHLILNPPITPYELWVFSQSLINRENKNNNPYRYKAKPYVDLDLMEVIREGYNTKSLKAVGINLKSPKIQDLPIPFDAEITNEQVQELIDYNINDLKLTTDLFNFLKERLEMRIVIFKEYNIDVLSDADSYISKALFNKFYYEKALEKNPNLDVKSLKYLRTERESIAIKDLVLPIVQFKTAELNIFFNHLLSLNIEKVSEDEYGCDIPELAYAGMTYTIALGGIHSVDKPLILKAAEDEMLLDVDKISV